MTARRLAALDVYVLEDNAQTRRLICTVLRTLGVGNVRESGEGNLALAEIRQKVPDIIFSDWEMQPMGGAEFVRTLRHESRGDAAKTPVIVLSAHTSLVVIKEALDAGANQFLAKPVVPGKLLERIAFVLNDRRQLVLKDGHYVFAAPASAAGDAVPTVRGIGKEAWEVD